MDSALKLAEQDLTAATLNGTEKQIAWAADIRTQQAREYVQMMDNLIRKWDAATEAQRQDSTAKGMTPERMRAAVLKVFGESAASWWIENRTAVRTAVGKVMQA